MVRYPFESKDGRVNKYALISFILAIVPAYFESSDIRDVNISWEGDRIGFTISVALRTIFILTFILSIAYTCKKLRNPGFSKEVR